MKQHFILFGNTNNEHYRLGAALKSLGHKVSLVLYQRGALHDPDSLKKQDKGIKIFDFRSLEEDDFVNFRVPLSKLKEILNSGDFVFFDGVGPAYHEFCRVPFSTYITGSNLTYYANYDLHKFRSESWTYELKSSLEGKQQIKNIKYFSNQQRIGIANSVKLILFPKDLVPQNEVMLNLIGASEIERLTWFVSDYSSKPYMFKNPLKLSKKIKALVGFRIDSQYKHPGNSELDDKGVNQLLNLIEDFSGVDVNFTIFNKGKDLIHFKERLQSNNLSEMVSFIDEQPYKNFKKIIYNHDVIIDSLGKSPIGRITIDGITSNKLTISSMNKKWFSSFFPFLNASDLDSLPYLSIDHTELTKDVINCAREFRGGSKDLIKHLFDPIRQARDLLSNISR